MASFAQLKADVMTLTNRPDLSAETELAIRQATLKAHHSDYYPKDLYETGIRFSEPALLQDLEYKQLIPRFRALRYIRKTDVSNADLEFIEILDAGTLLDSYKRDKDNVCYLAGEVLHIRSSTPLEYVFFGCYIHPLTSPDSYKSWIADEFPFAIVYEAAATVFKTIGFDEQAAAFKQLSSEHLMEMRNSSILAQGY